MRCPGKTVWLACAGSGQPDVALREFADRCCTQQCHGPADLTSEDLRDAIHAPLPGRHQAIEIGPPDKRAVGTKRERGDDVGT